MLPLFPGVPGGPELLVVLLLAVALFGLPVVIAFLGWRHLKGDRVEELEARIEELETEIDAVDADARDSDDGVDSERPNESVDSERPNESVDSERPNESVDSERPDDERRG